MKRKKWLALLALCMMLPVILLGCAKEERQEQQKQLPQPPTVFREGWQGYPVAGLTVYLPELFEEGSVFEEHGEFLSQDEDLEEAYVQVEILSGVEDELEIQVTDEQVLARYIQEQVEENEGVIYASGTYWDVTYLIYSEYGSEQDTTVAGLYANEGRGWMIQISGVHVDLAVELVPYVCGGVVYSPSGWDVEADQWMAYDIAGMEIRVPGELLEEADFYPDHAYFVDSQSETELEVSAGLVDEFEGEIRDAEMLADWVAREAEDDGDMVLARGEKNGVPYLIFGDGETATLVGLYVSGERYWMITAEYVAAEPEDKWIALVTGGKIGG